MEAPRKLYGKGGGNGEAKENKNKSKSGNLQAAWATSRGTKGAPIVQTANFVRNPARATSVTMLVSACLPPRAHSRETRGELKPRCGGRQPGKLQHLPATLP